MYQISNEKFGLFVTELRKKKNLTQKDLAEKLYVSDKTVSKWERGVCLPDVSVYKELCSILGISLNEFLAGEDIAQENIIQKSETNIIEVIRDNINKQKCLKVMKCILVFIFICVVSVIGFTIYRLKKPQNYISPVAKDSIEMQTAELLAGSDGVFVYKFITTDKYKKLKLHIYRYESGKLSDQDKVKMGFEDSGSPKSGEIVMVPDFDNYVIKLIISGDGNKLSTEIPILENVEDREYYGRAATEIQNIADIRYNKQQPLIAFLYDDETMSVPALDDLINSQTEFISNNDYVYYVAFEFCK
ncbi:helix-turn-helix domain-containing protein [Dorea formicigenerans]|uniref:helix-turn-helix domain-containing protein n=1 Tax=Dorea formicigenerans TaxID=39486 RepID=UPI0032BF77F2